MSKYKFSPTDQAKPLPGLDFENQASEFLEDASTRALWDRVSGRPGEATPEKAGLMPADAMAALEKASQIAGRLDRLDEIESFLSPGWLRGPNGYLRSSDGWSSSPTCLFPPSSILVALGGALRCCQDHPPFSLNTAGSWDASFPTGPDRLGRDFYIHIVQRTSGSCSFILSAFPDAPVLDNVEAFFLVGGFHCLCAGAGEIDDHPLSGLTVGAILPRSLWDLWHRPKCSPAEMVHDPRLGKWVDIYLPGSDGASGFRRPVNGMPDAEDMRAAFLRHGKELLTDEDNATALSGTSPEDVDLPATAGGHADDSGRRILSNIGLEDKGRLRGCALPLWG